jgi:iron complex outermembrane recepter protein
MRWLVFRELNRGRTVLKTNQKLTFAVAAVLSASASTVFAATDTSSGGIEEIVVTAQRRSESIQNVPITIQALTSDTLKQLSVTTAEDFMKYLPNVTLSSNGPGQGNIYMRGLSLGNVGTQSSGTIGGFPNVAVYLDDQSGALPSRNLDVYAADLERIEVLEGPQGTLFGGGAEAGVIRYITNKPKLNVTEGNVEGGYGTTAHGDPNSSASLMLNLPLINDTLAVRVVAYNDSRGGYINNVPSTFTRSANDYGIYYAGYATSCLVGTPSAIGFCSPNKVPVNGKNVKNAQTYAPPPGSPVANNYALAGDAINPVTYKGMRASALWQINDDWSAVVSQSYQDMRADGVFYQMPRGSDYGVNLAAPQNLPPLSVTTFSPSYDKDKFSNTALTINGKIGDLKVVYAGAYLSRSITQVNDYTNYSRGVFSDYYQCYGYYTQYVAGSKPTCFSPVSSWYEGESNTHQSHEFRISTPDDKRVRGLFGAYWESFQISDDTEWSYKSVPTCSASSGPMCFNNVQPVSGSNVANPNPRNDNVAFFEDTHRDIKQTAFFGSVDIDLIPKVLTLTGGTRYFKYDEDFYGTVVSSFDCFNYASSSINEKPASTGPCTNYTYSAKIQNSASYHGFKSRANLTWHVTPDTMVYYTWSQGYRPGGFNRSSGGVAPSPVDGLPQFIKPLTVAPDELINSELGFKSEFLDHRLQINGSVYDEKWNSVQGAIFNPQLFGNTTFGVNAADYEVKGLELQVTAKVMPQLTLTGSGSWNNSKQVNSPALIDNNPASVNFGKPITSEVAPNGQTVQVINTFGSPGVPTAFSPPIQFNLRARYDFNVNDYKAFWQVGMVHVGHQFSNSNTDPSINGDILWPAGTPITTTTWRFEMPAYSTYDGALGIAKDNWTAQLYGQNLTDSNASTFTSTAQFVKTEVPLRPRVLGLRISMKF